MKATIDEGGTLKVQAETPLEAYALKKWSEENFHVASHEIPNIVVNLNIQNNS